MPDKTNDFPPFILSGTMTIVIMPSDEELYVCLYFCGAKLGIVFVTTKFRNVFFKGTNFSTFIVRFCRNKKGSYLCDS